MSGNDYYQLPVGTVLEGRYRVGEILGEGGFGITYLGHDIKLDIPVAIKEYYPFGVAVRQNTSSLDISVSRSDSSEIFRKGKESFLTEARNLGRFSDEESVVYVRDHFEANNTAYIIMEYLDGQSLKDYVEANGPMTFEQVFALLEPIMDVLDKIHAAGMIHRDVSPSNMFILKNGKVKLLDFGTARDINADGEKSLSVVLKPGYAPVEQYQSHGAQGPWSDVYALCASIYKLITGVTPENAVNRISGDKLKRPSELGAEISPVEENALMAGLEVRAADRIGSMKELKSAFQGYTLPEDPGDDPELTVGRFNTPVPPVVSQKPYSKTPGEPRRPVGTGSGTYSGGRVSYGGFCTSCGAPLPNGAAYCPICSAPVTAGGRSVTSTGNGGGKSLRPLSILFVAAVAALAVLVGVFVYKKLTDDNDPKEEKTAEETTQEAEESPEVTLIPTDIPTEMPTEVPEGEEAAPEEPGEKAVTEEPEPRATGLPDSVDSQTPFYGVWCRSSKELAEVQSVAGSLEAQGYKYYIVSSDNWSGLENGYYAVSAGRYASEAEAQSVLESVRSNVIGDAYVKYTGDYVVPGSVPAATPVPTVEPTPTPVPTEIYEPTPEPVQDTSDQYITVIGGIQAPRSNFMFPDSSTRLLTEEEIESLYRDDQVLMHDISQLAINEIYARYGYTFTRQGSTSAQLARDTFEGRDWYVAAQQLCPVNNADVLKESYMNDIERTNIDNIGKWQQIHVIYY